MFKLFNAVHFKEQSAQKIKLYELAQRWANISTKGQHETCSKYVAGHTATTWP